MSDLPVALDHMLAAWNELDLGRVRGHLERALSPDVYFVDPSVETRGIDEFEANVREFRTKLADARCSRTSNVETHHRLYRYHWAIHRGADLFLTGFDVVELDDAARVWRVYGFFGPLSDT